MDFAQFESLVRRKNPNLGEYWHLAEVTAPKLAIWLDVPVTRAGQVIQQLIRDRILKPSGQEDKSERLNVGRNEGGRPAVIYSIVRPRVARPAPAPQATPQAAPQAQAPSNPEGRPSFEDKLKSVLGIING